MTSDCFVVVDKELLKGQNSRATVWGFSQASKTRSMKFSLAKLDVCVCFWSKHSHRSANDRFVGVRSVQKINQFIPLMLRKLPHNANLCLMILEFRYRVQKDGSMASTNLQNFFNNPSTSREYTTASLGLSRNTPEILSATDPTDNFRLERNKQGKRKCHYETITINSPRIRPHTVKQYKGKRDPLKPFASVRLQTTDSGGNMLRSYNGPNTAAASSPDVIDLVFSNDSSTSKSTICNEELIASSQMSTSTDTSVSSTQQQLNKIENEKRKKLMEAALMAIDKNYPCMTTVDRVMNWKIADDLDEVEEFSSSASDKLVWFIFLVISI